MTTPVPHYERREVNGSYTTVEIDLEPGRTIMAPIRTTLLGTKDGDAMIAHLVADRLERKDALRDFT